MAKNRSEECKYPSKFGVSRYITAAQYLAELMCERQARQQRRQLPIEFWKIDEWKNVLKQQLVAVNRLINKFDPKVDGKRKGTGEKAISKFLRSDRGKNIYSLSPLWIIPLVETFHRDVQAEKADAVLESPPENPPAPVLPKEAPRPAFVTGKSVFDKLRSLENG